MFFVLGLMISGLFFAPYARAQIMYPTPAGIIPTEVLGPSSLYPRLGTPAVSSAVAASLDAALVTAAGSVPVTSGGVGVKVPVTVTARVSAARIAGAATGCASVAVGNPIGAVACAGTIAAAAVALKEAGLGYGPCPAGSAEAFAFICKAAPLTNKELPYDAAQPVWVQNGGGTSCTTASPCTYMGAANAAIARAAGAQSGSLSSFVQQGTGTTYDVKCMIGTGGPYNCYSIFPASTPTPYVKPGSPVTASEYQADLVKAVAKNPSFHNILVEKMMTDYKASPSNYPAAGNPIDMDTPVSVSASPVTTPERVVKQETVSKPDGSTDTTTTKSKEVVTPSVTGSTISNTNITYNTSTQTTTTTTNNVTNATTTTNTTENHNPESGSEPEDTAFTDSAMPEIPSLYTKKYPEGMAGVWRDKGPTVTTTAFWSGVKGMFPTVGAGSCPSFSMGFAMGIANYGSINFDVPCWIIQAIGVMMLVTATFTARKILF